MPFSNKSKSRRQHSLIRALRPGVAMIRKFSPAGYLPEPAEWAFRELKLNPNEESDWKVLAVLLSIHVFSDDSKSRGPEAWTADRQAELLFEVNKRQKKSTSRLSDEDVCRQIARDKSSPSYFRRSPRDVESKGQGLVKQLRKARQQFRANGLAREAWPLAFRNIGRI